MSLKQFESSIENLRAFLKLSVKNIDVDQILNAQQTDELKAIISKCEIKPSDIIPSLSSVDCPFNNESDKWTVWKYICYLYYLLLKITSELNNLPENEAPGPEDSEDIIKAIMICYDLGIKSFIQNSLNRKSMNKFVGSISAISIIIVNMQLNQHATTEVYSVFKEALSAIFGLISTSDEATKTKFEGILENFVQKTPTAKFFQTLFLIKADPKTKVHEQQIIHKYLLKCLYLPNGFTALCAALLTVQQEDNTRERWHSCTVISNIVGHRGHPTKFYKLIIEDIFAILAHYTTGDKSIKESFVEAAVHTLSKIYSIKNKAVNEKIRDHAFACLEKIISPTDLLKGTILIEENELKQAIKVIYTIFCATGPSDVMLPSELLIPYLPILIQLFSIMSNLYHSHTQRELSSIIIRCMANRDALELNQIIESIIFEKYSNEMKTIHPLVALNSIECNDKIIAFALKIGSGEEHDETLFTTNYQAAPTFIQLLKEANHTVLTYNVFLHLLELFSDHFAATHSTENNIELLGTVEELTGFIGQSFQRKYSILNALNELISYQPLYIQFENDPNSILILLEKIANNVTDRLETKSNEMDSTEEILLMVLSILHEFMCKMRTTENSTVKKLMTTLHRLRLVSSKNNNFHLVIIKLDEILNPQNKNCDSEYTRAMKILSELSEPYSKVYAMKILIDLLNARDVEIKTNAYTVLAIALKTLRDEDSYVFLNCIRLLISLMYVIEDPVLDALVTEYHLQGDDEKEVDYKLKIGEAIVKITEGLGEIAYKHKDTLIGCFLKGSQHTNKEFRTSNISNLGDILRLLSYQIHHNFEEIISFIENTLNFEEYVPLKRACAKILGNFLEGVHNLEDFEEYVLRIYRLLKKIIATESDIQTRIHATNGLDTLKSKVVNVFSQTNKLEKEIKIFGINEKEISHKDLFRI